MDNFTLKASRSAAYLCFVSKSQDHLDVVVSSPQVSARREVFTYGNAYEFGCADFFERLASYDRPWNGVEFWETLGCELTLSATCDSVGHVTLGIKISDHVSAGEIWTLTYDLALEFGALPKHAAEAKKFFGI